MRLAPSRSRSRWTGFAWATASAFFRWKAGTARATGEPSDLTRRRWRNFGISGAKLMWGGEAVAVRHDGRANPNQLMLTRQTQESIAVVARRAHLGASRALWLQRRQRSVSRTADHPFRPFRATRRLGQIVAARRLPSSDSRQAISERRAHASRMTRSTAWWTTTSRRRGWPTTAAISSSTRRPVTDTSDTRCLGRPRRAGQVRRLARKPDAFHHADHQRRSAAHVPGLASSCASRSSISCRTVRAPSGVGMPEQTTGAGARLRCHER